MGKYGRAFGVYGFGIPKRKKKSKEGSNDKPSRFVLEILGNATLSYATLLIEAANDRGSELQSIWP